MAVIVGCLREYRRDAIDMLIIHALMGINANAKT